MSSIDASTPQVLEYSAAPARPRPVSITVENWLQTVAWTGIGMSACIIGYVIEKYGFKLSWATGPRMFGNPAEIAMRIFGLPHFIVGLYFMLSAKRMRTAAGWAWFFGL